MINVFLFREQPAKRNEIVMSEEKDRQAFSGVEDSVHPALAACSDQCATEDPSPSVNRGADEVAESPSLSINDADNFPFDIVFVFDEVANGAKEYADNLYSDLVHDGLLACKYVKSYRNHANRIFVGIGASDRFLHGVVEHYHFTEERTEARSHNGLHRIYAQNTRQRILMRFIKLRRYGGPHASIKWLQESGILADHFCLHDPKEVVDLRKGFFSYFFLPKYSFIADVEEYFGEELAMYMAWLRTLIVFMGPLCVVFAVFFAFEIRDNFSSWSMAAAGYFAPVYVQFFHEYWKRQEKRLAFEFGTLDMEESAEVREGFRGTQRLVQWKKEKRIRHEGEGDDTVIVKAGEFELPIQHTIPLRNQAHYHDSPTSPNHASPLLPEAAAVDPFNVKVVQQLNFDALPQHVMEKHYPSHRRALTYMFSIPTSITFCVAVMVAIYAIDFIREVLAGTTGVIRTEYSIAISVINGVVIVILNTLYPIVTMKLVERENHRTQEAFENSYILKLFIFVFVNSYFPIYLQVFKLYIINADKLSEMEKSERIEAVVIQIFTACVSTVFVSNIQDIVVPFFLGPVLNRVNIWMSGKQLRKIAQKLHVAPQDREPIPEIYESNEPVCAGDVEGSPHSGPKKGNFITRKFTNMESTRHVFEHQIELSVPQPVTTRFMGRIILFGFAVIFAALFPLGAAFVFLDAVITTRVEIVRYLYLMRRMTARQVESIGGWRDCIQIVIVAAAVTNCVVLSLQTDSLLRWYGASGSWEARLTIFIATEHIVMFLVWGVEFVIPDVSMDILRIKALQRYLMLKDENRLTYDPIDLQMPAHILIPENILPDDDDADHRMGTISNTICAQCHEKLNPSDMVRKFPCHHHVHETCLSAFKAANGVDTSAAVLSSTAAVLASCPSCGLEVDCRYFEDNVAYQKYTNVRYRVVDEFLEDPDVHQEPAVMKAVLEKENRVLRSIANTFGLGETSFPEPGPAPTGRPPRIRRQEGSGGYDGTFEGRLNE